MQRSIIRCGRLLFETNRGVKYLLKLKKLKINNKKIQTKKKCTRTASNRYSEVEQIS